MKERIDYRARKWIIQQFTSQRESDQFTRLQTVDWDILVILDACRADVLRQAADWPVNTAVSPASCTPQWLQLIESNGIFEGAHIISGNPQYEKVDININNSTVEPFWRTYWNNTMQTTLPEPILNGVDDAVQDSSNRVVAHLQQPHWPYVAKLEHEWMLAYNKLGPWHLDGKEVSSVQVAMQRGIIDSKSARRAYESSVRSIWKSLIEYLVRWIKNGYTVVITADHGETFGRIQDLGFYEHPCRCHLSPLVQVPWIELAPTEETRQIDSVEDRLRALGYAE